MRNKITQLELASEVFEPSAALRGQITTQALKFAGSFLDRLPEMKAFESAREELFANPVAKEFLEAQDNLHNVQSAIGKYVGMTLELGRVPKPDDFKSEDGCCSSGGCGCE